MKLKIQKTTFQPISIVIETEEELKEITTILSEYEDDIQSEMYAEKSYQKASEQILTIHKQLMKYIRQTTN